MAYVDDQDGETISAQRGGFGKPGRRDAVPRPQRRGEPRPVPSDARRGVRRRGPRAARQDRHAAREHAAARPGDVPHPARAPSPHRRRAGSSTRPTTGRTARPTRSRASPTRCARSSSTATAPLYDWFLEQLPLPYDQPRADRVRPTGAHPHGDVASASSRTLVDRRRRRRLGRPADADPARAAPARLPGAGDPRVLRVHRGRPHEQQASRSSCSSRSCATTSTARAPRGWRCCVRCKLVVDQLAARGHRSSSTSRCVNNPENAGGRHALGAVQRRAVDRARRLHARSAAEVLPARAGSRGAAARRLSS